MSHHPSTTTPGARQSAASELLTAIRHALDAPTPELPARVALVRAYIGAAADARDHAGTWRLCADLLTQAAASPHTGIEEADRRISAVETQLDNLANGSRA